MATELSPARYRDLVEQVRACVQAHVPPGAVVSIVSKGDEELTRIDGYRAWHFPRDEWGAYAGHHPASSLEAIRHLEHLYSQGARYLVLPSTAAWWLEHYREFARLLDSAHRLVVSQEGVCAIYELQQSAAFDASNLVDQGDEEVSSERPTGAATACLSLRLAPHRPGMRVLTILARFGTDQYAGAEDEIAALFATRMDGVERRVVVVDNALPRHFVDERAGSVLIGGDNRSREFSAFDRAIEFVGREIWSYDLVHCATSAFNTLYVAYLERFDTALLHALSGRPACAGHIDCYNEPIAVGSYRSQHWIRSCFFFLPPAELMALGTLVSVADGTPFFTGDPEHPFKADAPISQRYREYITHWLTGDGVGQGVAWHSTFSLTRDTVRAFEQKALAILNEHLLSIRLQAQGCRLVDVTWLSTMLARQAAHEIPLGTSWREQVANRDRDALVLSDWHEAPVRTTV